MCTASAAYGCRFMMPSMAAIRKLIPFRFKEKGAPFMPNSIHSLCRAPPRLDTGRAASEKQARQWSPFFLPRLARHVSPPTRYRFLAKQHTTALSSPRTAQPFVALTQAVRSILAASMFSQWVARDCSACQKQSSERPCGDHSVLLRFPAPNPVFRTVSRCQYDRSTLQMNTCMKATGHYGPLWQSTYYNYFLSTSGNFAHTVRYLLVLGDRFSFAVAKDSTTNKVCIGPYNIANSSSITAVEVRWA